ncbi:hypothetical protein NPIL_366031 [Nephila pilipes]|uniref:Uncharacterized protein n=1 Tax=Nephila pilipes TaxID=299642 RepID=A0A8X6UU79_NEPPI|nr:hypothetical protein NPIL_366031 [Nephila pilipes]
MAIHFVSQIVLHLLQHALNCVFGVDVPSFFEILLFEVVVEIFKYFNFKPQLSSPLDTEPSVPFEQLSTNNGNNKTPVMIFKICQALDLRAELASLDDQTDHIKAPTRDVRKFTKLPVVYSLTMFKVCQVLDLKAELHPETERPTFVTKKRCIPVFHSRAVFSICQGLDLKVKLADF